MVRLRFVRRSEATVGAAIAVSFTLAEVFADALAGGRSPIRFWLFLACYYVPGILLLGGAVRLVTARAAREEAASPTNVVRRLVLLLAFAYVAAVSNQEFLRTYPFLAPIRLCCVAIAGVMTWIGGAALAGWLGALGARGVRPPASVFLLLPTVLTVSSWLSIGFLQGLPAPVQALALPSLVVGSVTLGGGFLAWVGAALVTKARRTAAGIAVVAVFGSVLGRELRGPSDIGRFFKDLPHPGLARGMAHEGRPNIVLIVLDTLRAGSMSCYGYERRTTPGLDDFAREAVLYSNSRSVASFTVPGHASLFTGLLPSRHGAGGVKPTGADAAAGPALREGFTTLAEILSAEGYATAGVVANHWFLDRTTHLDQGFHYYDALPSSEYPFCRYLPLLKRLEGRLPHRLLRDPLALSFPTPYRSAEEITQRAREWILDRRAPGRPYFLFVNYVDTHTPYAPRGRFRGLWPGLDTSGEHPPNGLSKAALRDVLGGRREMSRKESAHLHSLYDGALSYLDRHVGELLRFLKSQRDYDDTWIVVTSDHGEALGDHGHLGHGCSLHQEILRIPLIVRYPRGIASRQPGVDERPVQQTDILPTILDGLGIALPEGLDGVPIRAGRERMFAEAYCVPYLFLDFDRPGERTSIVEGALKYIETAGGPPQLFDLRQDPLELHNLADDQPENAEHLRASLTRWRQTVPARGEEPAPRERVPTESSDRLRGLGYLE